MTSVNDDHQSTQSPEPQGEDQRIVGKRSGPADGSKLRIQNFSFFRAGQVIDEQMQAIGLLNDVFAHNLAHNLGIFFVQASKSIPSVRNR